VYTENCNIPRRRPPGMTRKPIVGTWLSLVERTLGVGEVASSNLVVPTILLNEFSQIISRVVRRVPPTMWPQSKHIAKQPYPFPAPTSWFPFRESKMNFARDLQERLGILARFALPGTF
jgi:hypothetical protein